MHFLNFTLIGSLLLDQTLLQLLLHPLVLGVLWAQLVLGFQGILVLHQLPNEYLRDDILLYVLKYHLKLTGTPCGPAGPAGPGGPRAPWKGQGLKVKREINIH